MARVTMAQAEASLADVPIPEPDPEPTDDELMTLGRILHRFIAADDNGRNYVCLDGLTLDGSVDLTEEEDVVVQRLYGEDEDETYIKMSR